MGITRTIQSLWKLNGFAIPVMCAFIMAGCAANNPPNPVYGVDIKAVNAGDPVPFKGTLFSDFYLNEYLQWKDKK